MKLQTWSPVLRGEHIPIASMTMDKRGIYVTEADHVAAMKRVKGALQMARKYVVSHSPAALVSEVRAIDAILAEEEAVHD